MTVTVTQLNNYISGVIDVDGILSDISVSGEVTNVKRSRDGWYFSLKDDSSQIDCFCYETVAQPISGMQTIATGKINYFGKFGRLSFFVRKLVADGNIGAAHIRFLQLKEKLQKEGLFEKLRKKQLPKYCNTVGVVTSENGAVIHDIEKVALRRQPFCNIVLYPVKVQGNDAPNEIVQGINFFNSYNVDVVIVARGGGSEEDLSAFNDERVVRTVANCLKPTVSAVGHGVNSTLTDYVADICAATPSEAAEYVTIDVLAYRYRLQTLLARMYAGIYSRLEEKKSMAVAHIKRVSASISFKSELLKQHSINKLKTVCVSVSSRYSAIKTQLDKDISRLNSANPIVILQRGYGAIQNTKGKVSTISDVSCGDKVDVTLSDGSFKAEVLEIKEKKL